MKKLALFICSCLLLMACNSGGGGGGGDSLQELDITVSGTFAGGKFTASSGAAPASYTAEAYAASPMAANQFLLAGKLDDGANVYALTGTYNSETGRYMLGAASTGIVYNIRGAFDETGGVEDIEMGKIVESNGEWTSSSVTVTPSVVTINNPVDAPSVVTLPSSWAGNWQSFSKDSDRPMWMVLDPIYGLEASIDRDDGIDGNYTTVPEEDIFRIIEVHKISNTIYEVDVLWGKTGDDAGYGKVRFTENSANSLTLQIYNDTSGDDEVDDLSDLTVLETDANEMTR